LEVQKQYSLSFSSQVTMYLTKQINGVEICYDECGTADRPALVLLTGWAHDIRLYDELLSYLSHDHWVIRVCWRGHGPSRDAIDDFGVEEQISDTIGLLDALEVDKFYLVSHSHGGWPALGIADKLGRDRVLCLLMIDQIMTPPPPEFAVGLQAMQAKETWKAARQGLYDNWTAGSGNKAVENHYIYSFGSFGHRMWALSCRVIAAAYQEYGTPMRRMEMIRNPPLIRHIFSHPLNQPEYRKIHEELSRKHSWFSFADLKGETHFPSLEIPEKVALQIEQLVQEADKSILSI
jgi:pimeloyl-ACP methyl ester carboxylesterase